MRLLFTCVAMLALTACQGKHPAQAGGAATAQAATPAVAQSGGTEAERELDWLEMMPKAELEAMQRGDGPEVSHDGEQAMAQFGTYNTVATVLGHPIRLPGYVVPLANTQDGRLTEFLFVPYYGACIHVPPPPPNQIVHVVLKVPVAMPDIYAPVFLAGTLTAQRQQSDLAGSAYTMGDAVLRPYEP